MQKTVERRTQIFYDVYYLKSKYDSFDTLEEAREVYDSFERDGKHSSIVKRMYETLEIKTEVVIQSTL